MILNRFRDSIVSILAVSLCLLGDFALGQQGDVFDPSSDVFQDRGNEADSGTDGDSATDGTEPVLTPQQQQIQAIYDQGSQLFEQGDYHAAIKQFAEVLKLNPRVVPALVDIGRAYLELADLDNALRSLEQACLYGQGLPEPFYWRGKVYMELERYREAAEDFRRARQLEPGNAEYEFQNGLARAEIGYTSVIGTAARESLDEAVALFDRAIELNPDYAEAFFERGSALLRMGELDHAIDDLEKATELDAENYESIAQLGFARLQRASGEAGKRNADGQEIVSDYQGAVEALERYFQIAPPPPSDEDKDARDKEKAEVLHENVHVARAVAYIGWAEETGGDAALYQKAIDDCNEAIAINPDLGNAYYERAIAERMMGKLDTAIESFTEAIELNPSNTDAVFRRGIVWFRKQDYDLALSDFVEARAFSTNRDPRVSFWAGLAHAKAGDHRAAIDDYSLAIRNRPDFTMAYMNRAIAYMKVGRFERAIHDLNRVLRREHDNEKARSYRALAHRMAGR